MSGTTGGKVYLVGAGPGDPKLLTLRAAELLAACDVVMVDQLVNLAILEHVRPDARILDVGKRAGERGTRQDEINALLVAYARRGHLVVRLKGGDPFVFGRGGEEAEALVAAGIPWEVVPGVTAGIAAAAYAGIPLTHRDHASRVTFVTGRGASPAEAEEREAWESETLVVFMCGSTIVDVVRDLIVAGRSSATPVALVRAGTWDAQEVYIGTLADVLALPPLNWRGGAPSMAIIGDVVALEQKLRWFGGVRQPLRVLAVGEAEGVQDEEDAEDEDDADHADDQQHERSEEVDEEASSSDGHRSAP